ncbi:MAG: thiolase domain-containing protein [Alphaproteobacteria bacterium]|nr:thiolase domain-containing protein [Alphaproteobacteria bacterium]
MTACIIGWGHTRFGKLDDVDLEGLVKAAGAEAIADAGIAATDIDAIYLGFYNGGMDPQEFAASLVLQLDPKLRFTPATRVENACATGSAAIYQGIDAIDAKRARIVLAVGVEKMTATATADVTASLAKCSYVKEEASQGVTFPGMFAQMMQRYYQRYGDKSDAIARIAAKNHRNGAKNSLAHMQKDLGFEFCRHESEKNPMVVPPLKRTDCSMISDGAAAVVLADVETALAMKKAIMFRAHEHVQDLLPMRARDILKMEGGRLAWRRAFDAAGVSIADLSLVETHDCFTIAELLEYEAMGLTPEGEGARAIDEGWTEPGGRLPVNLSGGLKSKGHPIGATGISMHVMAASQLAGTAVGVQHASPKLAGVFNMGGSAVANYVSILERLR